jgi:hypothetical protein
MLMFSILYVNINSSVIHGHGKIAAVVSSTIVLVLSSTIQSALAADITLFKPGSEPYGLTFGEWAAK